MQSDIKLHFVSPIAVSGHNYVFTPSVVTLSGDHSWFRVTGETLDLCQPPCAALDCVNTPCPDVLTADDRQTDSWRQTDRHLLIDSQAAGSMCLPLAGICCFAPVVLLAGTSCVI